MKQSIILNEMAIILIIICLSINSNGQDWPQWRGSDRNAHVKNFKVPEKWPDQLKQLWKKPVGLGDASPVLSGNKLYLITKQESNEVAICLNAKTGATAWADTVGYNRFAATLNLGNIILSQPANGKVIFYEANPGKYVQKAIYKVSDTEIYAHPLVSGNRIYIKDKENITCFSIE